MPSIILVSGKLVAENIAVEHILESGELDSHTEALARLRRRCKLPEQDMFRSNDRLTEAGQGGSVVSLPRSRL